MAGYNPLADGDLEIDHLTAAKTGRTDRIYFRLTAQGRKRRQWVEEFLGTSGGRHAFDRTLFSATKLGYSAPFGAR